MDKELIEKLSITAKSLFGMGVFSVGSGSISARAQMSRFVIDKKEAVLDHLSNENFILLNHARDYRWNDASLDAEIHSHIYQNIDDAKFVIFAMAPYLTAYSLFHQVIEPLDYLGQVTFKSAKVHDPKDFSDWFTRAPVEILRAYEESKKDFVVVKGCGVFAFAREIEELSSLVATIENSCKILTLADGYGL